MLKNIFALVLLPVLMVGCATVPTYTGAIVEKAKSFQSPTNGNAGLYVYRDSMIGQALKKDVWVDGECLGETAPNTFFYTEITGNKNHRISTESEFGNNHLDLYTNANQNYFVKQSIKMGVFSGGAKLKVVPSDEAMQDISKLKMIQIGNCSKAFK